MHRHELDFEMNCFNSVLLFCTRCCTVVFRVSFLKTINEF